MALPISRQFFGYSGIFIAKTIAEWGGNLTSFEVAYPSYLEAQYHARQCQITNVKRYPFDLTKIEDTSNILPKQCTEKSILNLYGENTRKSKLGKYNCTR